MPWIVMRTHVGLFTQLVSRLVSWPASRPRVWAIEQDDQLSASTRLIDVSHPLPETLPSYRLMSNPFSGTRERGN